MKRIVTYLLAGVLVSMFLFGATVARAQSATPVATAAPATELTGKTLKNANLRKGPGTNYAVASTVKAGQSVIVVGRNAKGDWLQLKDGNWIAAFLVQLPESGFVANSLTAQPAAKPTVAAVTVASNEGGGGQAFSCTGGCSVAPDASCAIKGNVNSKKEKIYHMPGWRDYDKTNVKPGEGDRWFCTEGEAVAAGFRAPYNH